MALHCKVKTAKALLAVFNVLFWVAGGALLVLGAWLFLDSTNERLLALAAPPSMTPHALFYLAGALLAMGLGALVAGVLGCCGALQGSRCLLTSFFALVLVLVACGVALAAGALASRVQLLSGLHARLHTQMHELYNARSDNNSDSVNHAQFKLQCCGVYSFGDWAQSRWWNETRQPYNPALVPATCCALTGDGVAHSGSPLRVVSRVFGGTVEEPWQHPKPKDEAACQREDAPEEARYKQGCAAALSAWYQQVTVILVCVAIGTSIFGLVGLVMTVCLCRAVADDLEAAEAAPAEGAAEGEEEEAE